MIIAKFNGSSDYVNITKGIWQWDYGQVLRIQGLNLRTAEEIHFSLDKDQGEAVRRVGVTKDGVTDVVIPDSMFENNGLPGDYFIYAFIYIVTENSGETTKVVTMKVESRPKPEPFDKPEDAELFRQAIEAVNAAADRAEAAASKEAIAETVKQWLSENDIGGVDPEELAQAVVDYFTENPLTAADVGALPEYVKHNATMKMNDGKYISSTGAVKTITGPRYKVSDPVYVIDVKCVVVTAGADFGNALYAFYDASGSKVDVYVDTIGGGTGTKITDKTVDVPKGAATIRIATETGKFGECSLKKLKPTLEANLPLVGKKWVCIGDSLTEKNLRTTMNYHDYIKKRTGCDVVNMGVSGTGYKNGEDENHAFYQVAAAIPADADIVTIFGSGNDRNLTLGDVSDITTDTVCGCINKTIDVIRDVAPLARLHIIAPAPWEHYNPENAGNAMDLYSKKLGEICRIRGIPFLDLYHFSGLRPWDDDFKQLAYSKDDGNGTHPDETGHEIISWQIEQLITGSYSDNGGGKTQLVPEWAMQPQKPSYSAEEVGARPSNWMPTAAQVGADVKGTAAGAVSEHDTNPVAHYDMRSDINYLKNAGYQNEAEVSLMVSNHNISDTAHGDIRSMLQELKAWATAFADSDDETLDQMSEIIAYIKSNKSLIEVITTSKVSVADIVDNLTTNTANKPLSAAQGFVLKGLIDAITQNINGTLIPQHTWFRDSIDALQAGKDDKTERLAKAATDTVIDLQPNKLYVFPEMANLSYALLEGDADVANEYHFILQSGATPTELIHPQGVNTGGLQIEANKIYEISIMENMLTWQSWEAM